MIPHLVVDLAAAMRGLNPNLVDYLLNNQQMAPVWRAISHQTVLRLPGGNLSPEHWLGRGVVESENNRDRAAASFFAAAVLSAPIVRETAEGKAEAAVINPARRRSSVDDNIRWFADAAKACRAARDDPFVALALPNLDAGDKDALVRAEAILKAAAANIERSTANHPLVVGRISNQETADAERVAARQLVKLTREMFGTPLYEAVAAIVGVMFDIPDDKIEATTVRDWSRPKGCE
jgi:hypothetical protein